MSLDYFELRCEACDDRIICNQQEMIARLQGVGMLRRAGDASWELLVELLPVAADRLRCSKCGATGLSAQPAEDHQHPWQDAPTCEKCGKEIPAERREVFPDTKRCADCQLAEEAGEDSSRPEFCPKCGSLMVLRQSSRGGMTRYVMFCTQCRR